MMATYAIDHVTGIQADAPAATVVSGLDRPKAHRTQNTGEDTKATAVGDKGKRKAIAVPPQMLTNTDMELAIDGKHYLCYRGE